MTTKEDNQIYIIHNMTTMSILPAPTSMIQKYTTLQHVIQHHIKTCMDRSTMKYSTRVSLGNGEFVFDIVVVAVVLVVVLMTIQYLRCHGKQHKRRISFLQVSTHQPTEYRKQKLDFIKRVGLDVYGYSFTPGGYIDDWRHQELPTLILPIPRSSSQSGKDIHKGPVQDELEVYLDYAGSALPTQSQLNEIMKQTCTTMLLANPHSSGPAAARTKILMEQAKKRILDHFHAQPGKYYATTTTHSHNYDTVDIDSHPGYDIVFTSGATEALRIIAEHFPWGESSICHHRNNKGICQYHSHKSTTTSSSLFVYPQNSHTSVLGIREEVLRHPHTNVICQPIDVLMETILQHSNSNCNSSLDETFQRICISSNGSATSSNNAYIERESTAIGFCPFCAKHLLVLPLECNFGGDRSDVQLTIHKLHEKCALPIDATTNEGQKNQQQQRWYTMLDMAKAASTSPINLCELNPDFACVSFYKMFGEPTGLGCLFVKRTAIDLLFPPTILDPSSTDSSRRRYVGGGSVDIIVPGMDYTERRLEPTPLISLTHGTPHFRGIVALLAGFNELDRRGGMRTVQQHTQCLAQEFVRRLQALRHSKGQSAFVIYGDWKHFSYATKNNAILPGPTVAFNVVRPDGSYVGYNEVSKLAALCRPAIQLRTGCFCNPGACQIAFSLSNDDMIRNYKESGHVCGDPIDIVKGHPTGAIRASFGKDSIWEDMNALIAFLEQMFVNHSDTAVCKNEGPPRDQGAPTAIVITELYIFPIKSCAAQRVSDWPMDTSSGRLRFDREFALVDSSGSAMRLQIYPAMSLLRPFIDLITHTLTIKDPDPSRSVLELKLDSPSSYQTSNGNASIVKVCGNRCSGILWGDPVVSDWFSEYLGVRCWLARHSNNRNGYYENPALTESRFPTSFSFANEQPLLLISEHAVHILNEVLRRSTTSKESPPKNIVCSRHFRPNIVIRLASNSYPLNHPHYQIEDTWSRISLRDNRHEQQQVSLVFDVVGPCSRCSMVDFDPSNGRKGKTLRALAGYRRCGSGQITFGIFLRIGFASESIAPCTEVSSWQRLKEGDVLLCE
jgi:molybdenum cofactor sulfurtransferase